MGSTRPPRRRTGVVVLVSIAALVSACAGTSGPPVAPAGPSSTTMPLGPRSTVTVDVTGTTTPPSIDVATLAIRAGNLAFQEFRTMPMPVHQRFAFAPPPGADAMGVVVRTPFGSLLGQSVDCTIAVDGVVVDREEVVQGCSYSSDPRWSYLLIKGVIPGRFWPPTG